MRKRNKSQNATDRTVVHGPRGTCGACSEEQKTELDLEYRGGPEVLRGLKQNHSNAVLDYLFAPLVSL